MGVFLQYWKVTGIIDTPNSVYTKAPANPRVPFTLRVFIISESENVFSAVNGGVLVHQECSAYFSSRSAVSRGSSLSTFQG